MTNWSIYVKWHNRPVKKVKLISLTSDASNGVTLPDTLFYYLPFFRTAAIIHNLSSEVE
jgi:hypothetical protein